MGLERKHARRQGETEAQDGAWLERHRDRNKQRKRQRGLIIFRSIGYMRERKEQKKKKKWEDLRWSVKKNFLINSQKTHETKV